MDFLNPRVLGEEGFFRQRYRLPIERYGDMSSLRDLKARVGPFILRRLKTDRSIITDLPEKVELREWVGLSKEQTTLYRKTVDDSLDAIARAPLGQRHGQVGGLDIAVARMLDRADKPVDIAQWPDILDLLGSEEVHLDPDGRGDPGILPVFVHPVPGLGEADVGDLRKTDILAGFLLKFLIEFDRVFMHLADGIAHVEQRQQACSMPGGAGGQFLALDQDNVAPALLCQMVEGGDPDDAAPDDDNPRMAFHICCTLPDGHGTFPADIGPLDIARLFWPQNVESRPDPLSRLRR